MCFSSQTWSKSNIAMHPTYGAHQLASVTELRTDTAGLLDYANDAGEAILIQRNNTPCGVLLGLDQYEEYLELKRRHGTPSSPAPVRLE